MVDALFALALQCALLSLLIIGARHIPSGSWNDEYLSLGQTKALQGFFALFIIFHHCGQKVVYDLWAGGQSFTALGLISFTGFLFVGYFFFCSGFGLYKSCQSKPNYLDSFPRRRPLPLLGIFYACNTIYLIGRLACGETFEPARLLQLAFGIELANPNSWFVIMLPIMYLLFYVCKRRCRDDHSVVRWLVAISVLMIVVGIVPTVLLPYDGYKLFLGVWWYSAILLFPAGYAFGLKEQELGSWMKEHFVLSTVLSVLFCIVALAVSIATSLYSYTVPTSSLQHYLFTLLSALVETLACAGFVWGIINYSLRWQIKSRVLAFYGSLTLELYLMHGFFVYLFREPFYDMGAGVITIGSSTLYILAVAACGTLAALAFKQITKRLL